MHGDKLDEIDIKILRTLQENARSNFARIGRAVSLSETAVANRIEKMESGGFIKGYTALVDRSKTSLPVMVIVMVKLKDPTTTLFDLFQEMVSQMPEVSGWYLISGNWNFVLHVNAATPQAYAAWLFDSILCHSYIADVESAYLMRECDRHKGIAF